MRTLHLESRMLQPRKGKHQSGVSASCLLLLLVINSVLGNEKEAYRDAEKDKNNLEKISRVKRDDSGFTTVLLINNDDDRSGRTARPSGVLTSTARTFVHDGTTTEYGTQVIGTTLDYGRYYAQILQTSSKIYFGNQEKSVSKSKPDERAFYKSRFIGLPQNVDNYIHSSIFHNNYQPSEPIFIFPTRQAGVDSFGRLGTVQNYSRVAIGLDGGAISEAQGNQREAFSIFQGGHKQFTPRSKDKNEKELFENLIRLEKVDLLTKRNSDAISPTKVFSNLLPTVTIRHDFAPSGFSVANEEKKEDHTVKIDKSKLRSGKSLLGGKPVEKKYDTVTYLGFADFVTTVGNTVIVFMPSTKDGAQVAGQTFGIEQTATRKPDQEVLTTVKTFLSHSPGMVTKTVPGHSLTMQTSLPTSVADRQSKRLGEDLELKSSVLAKEQILFENPVHFSSGVLEASEIGIEPSETMTYSSISRTSQAPTEPLATFATTVTRTFNTGGSDKPLGLVKSIGGTKAYNGTTTHFTSLVYGTYVDGSYTQILRTSSNVFYVLDGGSGIIATVVLDNLNTESPSKETEGTEQTTDSFTQTTPLFSDSDDELLETSDADYDEKEKTTLHLGEVTTEGLTGYTDKSRKIKYKAGEQEIGKGKGGKVKSEQSGAGKNTVYQTATEDLLTRLVPTTVYKTFTYLTTFFIPAADTTTTSIRSREVVTSEVNLLTKIIDPNLVTKEVLPTSSIPIPTNANGVDSNVVDDEFRVPDVRKLSPEEVVIIEESDEDGDRFDSTTATTDFAISDEVTETSFGTVTGGVAETTNELHDTTLFETTVETTRGGDDRGKKRVETLRKTAGDRGNVGESGGNVFKSTQRGEAIGLTPLEATTEGIDGSWVTKDGSYTGGGRTSIESALELGNSFGTTRGGSGGISIGTTRGKGDGSSGGAANGRTGGSFTGTTRGGIDGSSGAALSGDNALGVTQRGVAGSSGSATGQSIGSSSGGADGSFLSTTRGAVGNDVSVGSGADENITRGAAGGSSIRGGSSGGSVSGASRGGNDGNSDAALSKESVVGATRGDASRSSGSAASGGASGSSGIAVSEGGSGSSGIGSGSNGIGSGSSGKGSGSSGIGSGLSGGSSFDTIRAGVDGSSGSALNREAGESFVSSTRGGAFGKSSGAVGGEDGGTVSSVARGSADGGSGSAIDGKVDEKSGTIVSGGADGSSLKPAGRETVSSSSSTVTGTAGGSSGSSLGEGASGSSGGALSAASSSSQGGGDLSKGVSAGKSASFSETSQGKADGSSSSVAGGIGGTVRGEAEGIIRNSGSSGENIIESSVRSTGSSGNYEKTTGVSGNVKHSEQTDGTRLEDERTPGSDHKTKLTSQGISSSDSLATGKGTKGTSQSLETDDGLNIDDDSEEVEVIFKTLYTTYTYLTTYFHESTTSISSSEVVVTNIITSTLDIPSELKSSRVLPTQALKDSIEATRSPGGEEESEEDGIAPTSVITSGSETKFFDDDDEEEGGDDDEDEHNFGLSPSRESFGGEVRETPILKQVGLKTLYTTYTYFTTLLDDGTTNVRSRTEVVTNVVGGNSVSVLPSSILQNEALLKSKFEMLLKEQQSQRAAAAAASSTTSIQLSSGAVKPTARTFYSSISPSSTAQQISGTLIAPSLASGQKSKFDASRPSQSSRGISFQRFSIRPSVSSSAGRYGPFTRRFKVPIIANNGDSSAVESEEDNAVTRLVIKGDKKDRTVIRKRVRAKGKPLFRTTDVDDNSGITTIKLDPTPVEDDRTLLQTMVTDVRSSSSKGGRQIRIAPPEPIERIGEFFYDDQISSESNTDEVEPSPTLILQTSYTTFTYFTTVYKGTSSSDVISRLETVTNIVTETAKPEFLATENLSPEDATLPITYFTTFTYWTTLYKDGNTIITSREETVSNVVTPLHVEPSTTSVLEKTEIQSSGKIEPSVSIVTVIPSVFIPSFVPATTSEPVTSPSEPETPSTPQTLPDAKPVENNSELLISKDGIAGKLEPTTYYTTYTYFTTNYIGDSTELKSRLETITNVVLPTPSISEILENDLQTGRVINAASANIVTESVEKDSSESANPFQTGLLSTVVSTSVNDGKTTVYSTDIFGTFIDGLYAKVLESTTKVLSESEIAQTPSSEIQKTGVVSINEGKIVDADGISTTFFTTKAIGTSIEQLYAQVVESTTSVLVDNDKKSALAGINGDVDESVLKTGLVRLIEGSIIQDGTTTLYESRVIGTVIDGSYAQIIESTSSYKIEPSVAPSVTIKSDVTPTSIVELTSASPSAVESSIVDDVSANEEDGNEDGEEEDDEEGEDGKDKGRVKSRLTFQSKKRTFTPVIRPFASRNRPTFLPKKKPLGTTGAQTITRANFTPTITATLATKTDGFSGSSRNRFGSGRKSNSVYPSSEVKTTPSTARKFSRTRSSFAYSSTVTPSSFAPTGGRGRVSSARASPTPTLNIGSPRSRVNFRGTTTRAFNFESRPSLPVGRPRIRPTLSGLPGRNAATAATNPPYDRSNDLTTVVTEDEEGAYTAEEEGSTIPTTPTTTTEDPNLARRNNNPLLRFRRPLIPKASTTTTTPKPATTQAPRRGILSGRNNRLPSAPPSGTASRNTGRPQLNLVRNNLPTRSRPTNNLFPPRGLFKKPTPQEIEKEEEEFFDEEEEEDIENEDNNYDESSTTEFEAEEEAEPKKTEKPARGRSLNPVNIRPFNFQRRSKRQAVEYGSRNKQLSDTTYATRYRRPKKKPIQAQERIDYYDDEVTPVEPPKPPRQNGRTYSPRSRSPAHQTQTPNPQTQPRIRPTTASTQNSQRAAFTIREKDSTTNARTTNFRRGQNSTPRRKTASFKATEATVSRKSSRARTQPQSQALNDLTRNTQRRGYSNNRRTGATRSRQRFGDAEDTFTYQPPPFDGTITVTHRIPSEVTIPIVNGKMTEYRNVITAKPSIEVLAPHQYTVTSTNGGTLLFLNREVTETLNNGVTEITKFLVHETPTSSVIFTPTTIRGRKTSFSHIIPSTVYDVENIVTTVQPQLSANAPLANILLSQLLLGNLNIPPNQPLGIPPAPTAVTPTTEYKTKTTTYVTSVTDQISTVLPITFRGKEILTTVVDNTVNVITATEYITETVVVTPTINQQINSLLLPALLQAQLLNPSQQSPQFTPGFTKLPFSPNLGFEQFKLDGLQQPELKLDDINDDKTKLSRDNDIRHERESDDEPADTEIDDIKISHKPKGKAKKGEKKRLEPEPAKEIITLYVSGRRPGEFSTILSTVISGETTVAVRKREAGLDRLLDPSSASGAARVLASKESTLHDAPTQSSYLDYYVTPGTPELSLPIASREINLRTESLESVLGDVSKHVTDLSKSTPATKVSVKPTKNEYKKKTKKTSAKSSFSKVPN